MGDSLGRFQDTILELSLTGGKGCQTDAENRGRQLGCGREALMGPWGPMGGGSVPVPGQEVTAGSCGTSCRCVMPTVCSESALRRGSGAGFTQRDGGWQRPIFSLATLLKV